MARIPLTFALVTLLSSAPLVTTGVALAEPAGAPDRAAAPAEPTPPNRTRNETGNAEGQVNRAAVPRVESNVPATPVPMNLPDEAKTSEVKNEYGYGIAGLIIGTLLVATVIIGVVFLISRRSWSASH